MEIWYETKVRLERTLENGMVKKVTETYMVNALSFTEAEARTIEKITPYASGEFGVVAIKRSRVSEIFEFEGDKWYNCKLDFITLDEKSGSEKRAAHYVLVAGNSINDAKDNIHKGMHGTMSDYVISSISETIIMDVFIPTKVG